MRGLEFSRRRQKLRFSVPLPPALSCGIDSRFPFWRARTGRQSAMVPTAAVADFTAVHLFEYGGRLARMPIATLGAACWAFTPEDTEKWLAKVFERVAHEAKRFHAGQC